jgi:biotin carboxyl carrier protein
MPKDKPNEEVKYEDLNIDNSFYRTEIPDSYKNRIPFTPINLKMINASIPGTILEIFVEPGQNILAEEKMLILEAMKMRNIIISEIDGIVKKVHIKSGDIVSKNQLLIELE